MNSENFGQGCVELVKFYEGSEVSERLKHAALNLTGPGTVRLLKFKMVQG